MQISQKAGSCQVIVSAAVLFEALFTRKNFINSGSKCLSRSRIILWGKRMNCIRKMYHRKRPRCGSCWHASDTLLHSHRDAEWSGEPRERESLSVGGLGEDSSKKVNFALLSRNVLTPSFTQQSLSSFEGMIQLSSLIRCFKRCLRRPLHLLLLFSLQDEMWFDRFDRREPSEND